MTTTLINYKVCNGIAWIELSAPRFNLLTEVLLDAYVKCLHVAAQDDQVRAVIITSNVSGVFCAGVDLGVLRSNRNAGRGIVQKLYSRVAEIQQEIGKPTIAAVNGLARGGGMTLAIGCDTIICAEDATFGYPEIVSGLLPSIHFFHLSRVVGRHRAFELLFSGRTFDAREASSIGLVSRIVPGASLSEAAEEFAGSFTQHHPDVIRRGRTAFRDAADPLYLANVHHAVDAFASISASAPAAEGIQAFFEKRAPNWRTPRS